MSCLFVGNLTKGASEQKLINAFSSIGKCKVELKGPYAFIEYDSQDDAKEAMRKLNKTTLNGVNGNSKARIEFSKKKRVNDKLEDNYDMEGHDINISESFDDSDDDQVNNNNKTKGDNAFNNKSHHHHHHLDRKKQEREKDKGKEKERDRDRDKDKDRSNNSIKEAEPQKKNVCFICKLPGHFAKECVLTRDSCYECGEKGHIAKECQAGVREAKCLTKNRVKAIFSQQSAYKYLTPSSKMKNIITYISSMKSDTIMN